MIPAPAVDGRRVESFFLELKRYAPHYIPDLNLSDEQGVGVALMRIFAQLAEIVSLRLDQAPQKHFVAFLDQLGISLLPARSAKAAVTFKLAAGLQENVKVPIGTRVTAPGIEDDIPFETTGELNAIPGVLTAAYGVDPLQDKIFGPPPDFLKQEPRQPSELSYKTQSLVAADSKRLQLDDNTELAPGSFVLIGCAEKRIVEKKEEGGFITLYEPVKQAFPADTRVVPIRNFEVFNGIDVQEHILYIGHASLLTVKEEVEIKLEITLQSQLQGLEPGDLVWEFWTKDENATPEQDEHWDQLSVKLDRTKGLAISGEIVLVKKRDFEIKPRDVGGNESRWIRARLVKKLPFGTQGLPEIETIKVSVSTGNDLSNGTSKAKTILADQGFYNATPLNVQVDPGVGFFPFGTEPRQFDQFYIASKEAFSKREAAAVLDFTLDLQTLAAPSLVKTAAGLRSYSIGLRRRLYELNLQNLSWQIFPNAFDTQGSPFVPSEDSVPSAITDGGNGVFVFVGAKDSQTTDDPPNNVWVHFHDTGQTTGTWTDLKAPTPAQNKIKFSPAAVELPSGWGHFSRVFVVGGDGKLYSRGYPNGTDWDAHSSPLKPDSSFFVLDSPAFVIAAGANVFVFVNGEGVVHWLSLDHNLVGQWKSLTPNTTNFKASYRPFAQHFVAGGVDHAKVFAFGFTNPTNNTTGHLFECDTRDPADANQAVPWTDLGQPTATAITETAPEAHAPNGHLEHPDQPVGDEARHIFLRGADNKLYERMDGMLAGEPQWQSRSRPGDPDLRDSPAVHFSSTAGATRIQVFSASGRNSLVRWILEAVDKLIPANAADRAVLVDETLASNTDNDIKYVNSNLDIVGGAGSGQSVVIDAYDGALALALLGAAPSTALNSTSQCEINLEDVGLVKAASVDLFSVLPPAADLIHANSLYIRINNGFEPIGVYSRVTGVVSVNPAVAIPASPFSLYFELTAAPTEFSSPDDTGGVPELSWEYWNGRGWLSLSRVGDGTHNLLRNGEVKFEVPRDIQSTEVAGQENYWIRSRLVGGDYGRETFKIVGTAPNQTVVAEKSSLRPPKVRTLGISYEAKPAAPEACLTFNNLDYLDQTAACQTPGSHFPPFETPEDPSLTLFFGFDKTFKTGPVRLLLDAAERDYDESKPPEFAWKFLKDRIWKPLDADDDSVAITRQGILSLSASEELTRDTRFGQPLFWIKGSLRTDRGGAEIETETGAKDQPSTAKNEVATDSCSCSCSCSCSNKTEPEAVSECGAQDDATASAPVVVAATAEYPLPLLRGVFLNTVWATQGETITEEIVGSGDGEENQIHKFQNADVLEGEDVRLREVLSAEERERIERDFGKESVTDREDLGGTWIRWKAVKALFDCGPQDRCYEIDRATGSMHFGDGNHGTIPPAGVDNIRAFSYRTGGGDLGNLATNKIQSLATAVAGVESVFNPAPSGGGSDKADTNAMLTVGPRRLSHLDRAVSVEDFEELTYEASRQVAKVRCLATTNLKLSGIGRPDPCDPGQLHEALNERGRVSLIIVPNSKDPRPCPSLELRRMVKNYLRDRAPSAVAAGERIVVRPPDYVTVDVHADIFVTTLERASAAETEARNKLNEFLHPVTGGPDRTGWDFGRPVSKSDVFALLERISDIDRVENLEFKFRGQTNSDRVEIGTNELLASGEHMLAIKKA